MSYVDRFYNNQWYVLHDAIKNRGINSLLKNKNPGHIENVFEPAKLDEVSSFKEFIELDISRLSQRDLYRLRQGSFNDLIMSGYTGLFLASKNFEVEPFSINDLTKYLLTIIGGMGIVILSGLGWVYLRDYDRLENSIMSVTNSTAVLQEGFVVLNQILANQEDDIKGINIRVERLESPVVTP